MKQEQKINNNTITIKEIFGQLVRYVFEPNNHPMQTLVREKGSWDTKC